jgi:hypothetical protein
MPRRITFALLALGIAAPFCAAQQNTNSQPEVFFRRNCIKLQPGKTAADYQRYVAEVTRKLWQNAANEGTITSYAVFRAVAPAGEAAECDFVTVSVSQNMPTPPLDNEAIAKALKATSSPMTTQQLMARRDSISRLVTSEIWRTTQIVGQYQKGDYFFLNHIKANDMQAFIAFERDIWKPVAEQMVKDGNLHAWRQAMIVVPSGTDHKYRILTADFFPSWQAVFKGFNAREAFAKAHPGKNFEAAVQEGVKTRDIAKRELYVVDELVLPAKQISQK